MADCTLQHKRGSDQFTVRNKQEVTQTMTVLKKQT